jgi:hypothetical protein
MPILNLELPILENRRPSGNHQNWTLYYTIIGYRFPIIIINWYKILNIVFINLPYGKSVITNNDKSSIFLYTSFEGYDLFWSIRRTCEEIFGRKRFWNLLYICIVETRRSKMASTLESYVGRILFEIAARSLYFLFKYRQSHRMSLYLVH